MPQSRVKILVHIVFFTKNREHLILPDAEVGLYRYMSGIVEGNKAKLIIANGSTDHSHFLVSLGKNDVSELTGGMKRDSSLMGQEKRNSGSLLATRLRCFLDRPITSPSRHPIHREPEGSPCGAKVSG